MGRAFAYGEFDESFFAESTELLANAADLVVAAEKENKLAPAIPEVFRTFHTIKGGAQMVGCELLGTFAHQMEDLLDQVRTGLVTAGLDVAALVIDAIDLMEEEIDRYRKGEHPDEMAVRQELILERVRRMNKGKVVETADDISPKGGRSVLEKECVPLAGKRLVYLCFKIDESAPMPEITEILLRQRLVECGRVIHVEKMDCVAYGLAAVLQTDLTGRELRQGCDAADVKEIHIRELSHASFYHGCLPHSEIDEFQATIYELDSVVSKPDTSQKQLFRLTARLNAWGDRNIESSGCFPGGRSEWDCALELLKTGVSLWNQLRATPEQHHLLAQLVQNLWKCVYANLENKVYYFSLSPVTVGVGSCLLPDVKGRVKGVVARIVVLDLSAVAELEADGVCALLETVAWLKERGIWPAIVTKGEFMHRHNNEVEALAATLDGLTIYTCEYSACLANSQAYM